MLERYNPMLTAIKALCPTAHIAGGAVRDTLLERPLRDIDLFLDVEATDEAARLLRKDFGFVKVGEWESYEMFSDPAVKRVCKFEKADEEIPVCLIGLYAEDADKGGDYVFDMKNNLIRFDFGICMAGWDGDKVYVTPEYKADVKNKTFTLCRADDQGQFNYSYSRFEKLTAERYADWKLVVPAEFALLERGRFSKRYYYRDGDTGKWFPRAKQQLSPKAR